MYLLCDNSSILFFYSSDGKLLEESTASICKGVAINNCKSGDFGALIRNFLLRATELSCFFFLCLCFSLSLCILCLISPSFSLNLFLSLSHTHTEEIVPFFNMFTATSSHGRHTMPSSSFGPSVNTSSSAWVRSWFWNSLKPNSKIWEVRKGHMTKNKVIWGYRSQNKLIYELFVFIVLG